MIQALRFMSRLFLALLGGSIVGRCPEATAPPGFFLRQPFASAHHCVAWRFLGADLRALLLLICVSCCRFHSRPPHSEASTWE